MHSLLCNINVTRDCNLRCTHCYISSEKKKASGMMSEELFLSSIRSIADYLRNSDKHDAAEIHVIGGEPSMLGMEFYQRVLPEAKDILGRIDGKTASLGIVTNLVTADALAIAKLFDVVQTSYEIDTRFPKQTLRTRWEQNVMAMVEDSRRVGRRFGITSAITLGMVRMGVPKLMGHIVHELGVKNVHMGFFIPTGDGKHHARDVFPSFEQTTSFLVNLTDWFLEHRAADRELHVNPVESMMRAIVEERPMDDIVCPIITGSIDIDWNGDARTCLCAGGEKEAPMIGSVQSYSVEQIFHGMDYRREHLHAVRPRSVCMRCEEYAVCQSACGVLHDSWNGEGECPGFKGFIKHVRQVVEEAAGEAA